MRGLSVTKYLVKGGSFSTLFFLFPLKRFAMKLSPKTPIIL